MIEVSFVSTDEVIILYDNEKIRTPFAMKPRLGEHRLEIFSGADNIKQIKVFDQTLDRKKALRLKNSVLFVFDIVDQHANFSKHTGIFGTSMLRKDRIRIND